MKEKKDWHPFPEETYLEEMEAKVEISYLKQIKDLER